DYRRWVDRLPVRFVVKRDVAGNDRYGKSVAGFDDAPHGLLQLKVDVGAFRVTEVQAVGDRDRPGAGASQVAASFSYGHGTAALGIEVTEKAIAIGCKGDAPRRGVFQAEDSSVRPGLEDGVREHLVIVL